MKIQVFSDIHLEFGGRLPEQNPAADVIVIAGDTVPVEGNRKIMLWQDIYFKYGQGKTPIIYVLGNHEFYGGNLTDIRKWSKVMCDKYGFHLLDPGSVVIDGVRFIGGTLWTDWRLNGIADDFSGKE